MMSPSCLLATDLVGEAQFGGQISLKTTRPTVVSMIFASLLAEDRSFTPKFGFLQANPAVGADRAVAKSRSSTSRGVGKQGQTLVAFLARADSA